MPQIGISYEHGSMKDYAGRVVCLAYNDKQNKACKVLGGKERASSGSITYYQLN